MGAKESRESVRERLCADLAKSRKYSSIYPITFLDVIDHELGRHGSLKDAEAVIRRKLHRVAALYLGEPEYEETLAELREAFAQAGSLRTERVSQVCVNILAKHASTAERIPDLKQLYETIFHVTGKPRVLLDLACAFNPFSWRWMGLERGAAYHAYDINQRFIELLNEYFRLEGLQPRAELRDVLVEMPQLEADVALLFKMYHCLEARRRGAGNEVIEKAPARWVVVSLPAKNLEGRDRDLGPKYGRQIEALCLQKGWGLIERTVPSELFFLVEKQPEQVSG